MSSVEQSKHFLQAPEEERTIPVAKVKSWLDSVGASPSETGFEDCNRFKRDNKGRLTQNRQ